MSGLRRLLLRLYHVVRPGAGDAELDREVKSHLALLEDEYQRRGLTPDAARPAARRDFGNVAQVIEDYRRERGWPLLDGLRRDMHDSWRTVRRQPLFSLLAILVLATSLGVNAAIFSLVDAVLLRPLPVARPAELAFVEQTAPHVAGASFDDYRNVRRWQDVFTDLLATAGDRAKIRQGAILRVTRGEQVSANYFDVLGVAPAMGRVFSPDEAEARGAPPVAVISWHLWQTVFAADPDVLGRPLNLDLSPLSIGYYGPSRPYTIIGVMAPSFRGLGSPWDPSEYWVPLVTRAADYWIGVPDGTVGKPADPVDGIPVLIVGRRRPGVSLDRARIVIETLGQGLEPELRTRVPLWGLTLTDAQRVRLPFDPQGLVVPSHFATALIVVATALLSIAVANLVGLLLARGVTRRHEMVIRLTLGASRWRVARHVLTESLLLALAGGSLGLVLSRWLVGVVLLKTPSQYGGFAEYRVALDVPLDWRVLVFSLALCLIAGLATGLGPARQAATTDLAVGLAGGVTATSRHTRGRLRHAVIIPQVAGSLMLLVVAGVLVQALRRAEAAAPGYNPTGVVLLDFDRPMPNVRHSSTAEVAAWHAALQDANRRMLERIGRTPAVLAASLLADDSAQGLPLAPEEGWAISRDAFDAGTHHWVSRAQVSPGYFATLGIPLQRGRLFDTHDALGTPHIAVVSDRFAQWFWPDANPIGRYVAFHEPKSLRAPDWLEVVGVVGSVTPPLAERPSPAIYVPFDQSPSQYATTVVARGSGSTASLIRDLTAAIHGADGTTIVSGSRTMEEAIDAVLFTRRFAVLLVGAAGLIGLVLALIGLYGVVSHSVAQRLRELGIRATLGATRADIVRLILREGVVVVSIGCGLGLLLAFVALHLIARLVVAMPHVDGPLCALVAALISGVVLMACYLPARRAARADPILALRRD